MSNVFAFPMLGLPPTARNDCFNEAEIQAYVARNVTCNPGRVADLKLKLELAIKTAGVLQSLITTIRLDLDLDQIEGR